LGKREENTSLSLEMKRLTPEIRTSSVKVKIACDGTGTGTNGHRTEIEGIILEIFSGNFADLLSAIIFDCKVLVCIYEDFTLGTIIS
jgi:hypothetical protein